MHINRLAPTVWLAFISMFFAVTAWAKDDTKNVADGAAKGQASESVVTDPDYTGSTDAGGTGYYYQYFTDSSSPSTESLVLFFDQMVAGGTTTILVFEEFTGYTTNAITVSLTNDDTDSTALDFSNVEYFLSPTQIPLDDLNFQTLPPPGYTPLPGLDGDVAAGASTPGVVLPEPLSASVLMAGMGLACLRRRRIAS